MTSQLTRSALFWQYVTLFYRFAGWRFPLIIFLIFASSVLELVGIITLLPLLELTLGEPSGLGFSQTVMGIISSLGIPPSFSALVMILALIFIVKGVLTFIQNYWTIRTVALVRQKVQQTLVTGLESASYEFYLDHKAGDLANLITTETSRFSVSLRTFGRVIVAITYTILYLPTILVLEFEISAIVFLVAVFSILIALPLIRHTQGLSMEVSDRNGSLTSELIQFIQSFGYLKATAATAGVRRHIVGLINQLAGLQIRMGWRTSTLGALKEPLAVTALLGYIFYKVDVQQASLAGGVVVAVLLYRLLGQILALPIAFQRLHQLIGGVHHVSNFYDQISADRERDGHTAITRIDGDIVLSEVSVNRKGTAILESINMKIPKHKTIGIVGPSGAGKTTIFRLITGLIVPDTGMIQISGRKVSDLHLKTYRKRIGYVPQDPIILSGTIEMNLTLNSSATAGDPGYTERLENAARAAHCHDFINALPDKYETIFGDGEARLSGGERQRLAIARELYKDPDILIFDEATSALDYDSEDIIHKSIKELAGKKTIVVITHRLSTVANCDYIYVMSNGRITEYGDFEKLFQNPHSSFRRMWEQQEVPFNTEGSPK